MVEDLTTKYANCMLEIKGRTNVIDSILKRACSLRISTPDVEFIALQLRKSLEFVVFSNLVANIDIYKQMYASYKEDWNLKKIVKRIRKINPEYYPKPIKSDLITVSSGGEQVLSLESLEEGFIAEAEFIAAYELTNKIIHVDNPYGKRRDLSEMLERLVNYFYRLVCLLKIHQVKLINRDRVICNMGATIEDKPSVTYLTPL